MIEAGSFLPALIYSICVRLLIVQLCSSMWFFKLLQPACLLSGLHRDRPVPDAHVSLSVQLEVLNTLEKNDLQNRWHCVHLQEWFDYRGHVCMVSTNLPDC